MKSLGKNSHQKPSKTCILIWLQLTGKKRERVCNIILQNWRKYNIISDYGIVMKKLMEPGASPTVTEDVMEDIKDIKTGDGAIIM